MRSATSGDLRPGSRARHEAPEPALAVEAAVAQRASADVAAEAVAVAVERAEAAGGAGGVGAAGEAGGGAPTTLRRRLASADQGERSTT